MIYSRNINPLDKKRMNGDEASFKDFFIKTIEKSEREAINLLNDESLNFASLFILRPLLKEPYFKDSDHLSNLSFRNRIAIEIIDEVLTSIKYHPDESLLHVYIQKVNSVMRWIVETGFQDDGLSNEFDEILDISAIFLLKVYKEKSILTLIGELIFIRHRKGHLIHDLVWGFLESKDPLTLSLIAGKLRSVHAEDISLANKLLSFIPEIDTNIDDNEKQYLTFQKWIEENNLFLFYKGESFQQTNRPKPYEVIKEGKYLCRPVFIESGEISGPLLETELYLTEEFKKLDEETKDLLADFSFHLYRKDVQGWLNWLQLPLIIQIKAARAGVI